jgi:hypothetical protein
MTRFHKWLIAQRLYCEKRWCMQHATHVVLDDRGKEIVVCDDHSRPRKVTGIVGDVSWNYQPKEKRT